MADNICPKHEHMKSKHKKPGHDNKAKRTMDILEQTKTSNLDNSHQNIARHRQGSLNHNIALETHKLVERHNTHIHNEWSELISNIHAYDEHIYDAVLKENQQQQQE
jgi:uncharacterized membrane protein YccC